MRNLIRILILGTVLATSGCIIEPLHYHCGYYHCR